MKKLPLSKTVAFTEGQNDSRLGFNLDKESEFSRPIPSMLFHKKIWDVNDLMEVTGFAKQTIYNMVSQTRIPFRKRGRKLFFMPDEILNWIEEGD